MEPTPRTRWKRSMAMPRVPWPRSADLTQPVMFAAGSATRIKWSRQCAASSSDMPCSTVSTCACTRPTLSRAEASDKERDTKM
jgi:hypothetical protein